METQLNSSISYHKKLALQLQALAVSADIVLDLHCDTLSVPHVYSPTYAMNSVVHLGIPFAIEIPHTFAGALDEAIFCPWITLTQKYNELYSTQMNIPVERSEEHTSELQSHSFISYAVFCLKKKKK